MPSYLSCGGVADRTAGKQRTQYDTQHTAQLKGGEVEQTEHNTMKEKRRGEKRREEKRREEKRTDRTQRKHSTQYSTAKQIGREVE
jgi:hypothetical protein